MFDRLQRWITSKRALLGIGISVHFSDQHANYYTAWQYVTKEDENALHSPDHPDLSSALPQTNVASTATHTRRRRATSTRAASTQQERVQKSRR